MADALPGVPEAPALATSLPGGGRPLDPLLRKAATDAGFDLEPEREDAWWRLRASGAPGVVWVRPLAPGDVEPGVPISTPTVALLALPTAAQLAGLDAPVIDREAAAALHAPALPPGAAGCVACPSPERLHRWLRRTWLARAASPERLRDRWDAEVGAALAAAGIAVDGAAAPLVTEAIAQVRRRVGQDLYRETLLAFWEGRCAATGLAVPELLRASHAKPWKVATDAERLDVHNGLLLAPHLDLLFDRGFLAFDDDGRAIASARLAAADWVALGVVPGALQLTRVVAGHRPFLAYHRAHVFHDA